MSLGKTLATYLTHVSVNEHVVLALLALRIFLWIAVFAFLAYPFSSLITSRTLGILRGVVTAADVASDCSVAWKLVCAVHA